MPQRHSHQSRCPTTALLCQTPAKPLPLLLEVKLHPHPAATLPHLFPQAVTVTQSELFSLCLALKPQNNPGYSGFSGSPRAQKLLPREGRDVQRQVLMHCFPCLPFLLPPASSWVFIFVVLPGHPGKGRETTHTVCRAVQTQAARQNSPADRTVPQTEQGTEMLKDGNSTVPFLPNSTMSAGR